MLLSPQAQLKNHFQEPGTGVRLRCPRCFGPVGDLLNEHSSAFDCSNCGWKLLHEEGIWKALLPKRAARYAGFVENYESIRAAEGRGSTSADYYFALPYH